MTQGAAQGGGAGGSDFTPGGTSGEHPPRARLPLYVAPTDATHWNAVRRVLLPIACWRLEDLRFDFDSSFVRPEAAVEMNAFASLRAAHPGAPASLFGHADPVGDDAYNKTLSGRRALAVYALLLRDVTRWQKLYDDPFGGDNWGVRSIQMMVRTLGFDPGIIDGNAGGHTKAAIKGYQEKRGLTADGRAGSDTRAALFADYMDSICRDSSGQAFVMDPKADFLNKGGDPRGRGDVQACGEFNPLLVFSKDEDQRLSKAENRAERDGENLANRRVLVFLFPPGAKIDVAAWPCPAAEDGPSQCKSHFWPEGDTRRAPGEERRIYAGAHDTMACRFYDRMARRSPCEVGRTTIRLRLLDSENNVIPNAVYRMTLAGGDVRESQATVEGWLIEPNVETPASVTVTWGYPPEYGIADDDRSKRWGLAGPYDYSLDVILYAEDGQSDEDNALQHLSNLGYAPDRTLAERLSYFQRDYHVFPAQGELNDDTKKALAMADDEGLSRDEFIKKRSGAGGA